jgi:hypothetical protein
MSQRASEVPVRIETTAAAIATVSMDRRLRARCLPVGCRDDDERLHEEHAQIAETNCHVNENASG